MIFQNLISQQLLVNKYLKTKNINIEQSIYLYFLQESFISQKLLNTNRFLKNQTFFQLSNISQSFYKIRRKKKKKLKGKKKIENYVLINVINVLKNRRIMLKRQ